MKLVGFTGYDFNVNQLESLGATITHLGKVKSNLIATPYKAYIDYGSYDETRYRPYLVLDTEIQGAIGDFSNDITEFRYREEDKLLRSVHYDFTDEELGVLASKGLYNPEFEVPSLFTDTDFELPIDLDVYLVNMNDKTMVYASYDMISDLKTNSKLSGYDLVQYFDKQTDYSFEHESESSYDDNYDYNPIYSHENGYSQNVDQEFEKSDELELNQGEFELSPEEFVNLQTEHQHENIDDIPKINLDEIVAASYHAKTALEEFNSVNLDKTLNPNFDQNANVEVIRNKETIVEKHERENDANFANVVDEFDSAKISTESMKSGSSLGPDIDDEVEF